MTFVSPSGSVALVARYLTSFDGPFQRIWTTPVLASVPSGGVYGLAAVSDGYVVSAATRDGMFIGKYAFSGKELRKAADSTRRFADLVVSVGDVWYLIGAGVKDRGDLHVVRGR